MFFKRIKSTITKTKRLTALENLFRAMWAQLVPMLGVMSTRSMFEHARAEAALRYRLLEHIRVRDDGVRLAPLFAFVEETREDPEHLEEALGAYLEIFFQVLTELSGDVITTQMRTVLARHAKVPDTSAVLYRTGLRF